MLTLPIAYFPPLSYFSLLKRGEVLIEAHENYQKQSWRNRCNILTANGVESLLVPIVHRDGSFRHPVGEIEIDYSRDWMIRQKRAIDSAYMSSAYFALYRDRVYGILDERPATLWNLDMSLIRFFTEVFDIPFPQTTTDFMGQTADIHPKHPDIFYIEKPYFQVFSPKYGFRPNLSIMDLLFNEGPYGADLL